MKITTSVMLIVLAAVFFGALGLADTGLLNPDMARAQAGQINYQSDLAYQRGLKDLESYPQLAQEQAELDRWRIRLQLLKEETLTQEQLRVMVAENNNRLAKQRLADEILLHLWLVLGIGFVIVVTVGLLMVLHFSLRQRTTQGAIGAKGQPGRGDDPMYRANQRESAREREDRNRQP